MELKEGIPVFQARTRTAWRQWLSRHLETSKGVYLILFNKDSDTPSVAYTEAVEEALCFGWIDATTKKRDAHSRYQYFSPRRPRSRWARSNKERVDRMIAQGLMTPAGLKVIEEARRNGSWDALNDIDDAVIPDDLLKALRRNKKAFAHFEQFSPSARRLLLEWIAGARRPETRARRIAETVAAAAANRKAFPR